MKKVVIFYKSLVHPGGAERLLFNFSENLIKMGYKTEIICFDYNNRAFFETKTSKNIIVFKSKFYFFKMFKLFKYIISNRNSIFICDSGHIDFYLVSIFSNIKYSLHLHHPLYMSFNDFDKYSIFLKKYFNEMIKSNFGAKRFIKIRDNLSIKRKFFLNVGAFFSIRSIKKSKNNFVLSHYAKKEKKKLFNVESTVLCGALEESIFNYKPKVIDSIPKTFDKIIFTVGRLDINKRISDLIDSFSFLINNNNNYLLLIGGKGPEEENLKNKVKNLNLENNIIFLGFIDDEKLYDYYYLADLFVSIDWADFRLTSYEALAMGTKVILSDETEIDKFLNDSKFLYLTKPIPEETSKVILQAFNEEPTISHNDLLKYLENFTWENYTKNLINIINSNA